MKQIKRMQEPYILTTVKISGDFYKLCKVHGIKFAEAIRVGISVLLAERGIREYDNRLNIVRRLREMRIKARDYAQEAADLKTEMEERFGDKKKVDVEKKE